MLRRLFFLFPDEKHAQCAVDQLILKKIPKHLIHAIAHDIKLSTLPKATARQKNDTAFHIEQVLWYENLLLFSIALIAFLVCLFTAHWLWAGLAFVAMLMSYFAGLQFVMRVPDAHLTEFADALSHGEILLMIDVPVHRVIEIKRFVQHNYPEAIGGGISWTLNAFGI
ncbi:MAG: hypothetical protein OEY66_06730 [Gammaproteobacteria bacterium]|nr:hypothetical protein [Gammaproteobacteria bacterium]